METRYSCFLVGVLGISPLVGCERKQENDTATVPARARTSTEENGITVSTKIMTRGVELALRHSKECLAGQPVELTIVLTNKSGNDVKYGHISKYRDFEIALGDEKGKPVPFTRFGRRRLGGDRGQRTRYIERILPPGASCSVELDLSRLFDLTVWGTYEITVRKVMNEDTRDAFMLEIKGHRFVVTDPLYGPIRPRRSEKNDLRQATPPKPPRAKPNPKVE